MKKNIRIENKLQRVHADCRIGPTKARTLSIVLVERESRLCWFGQVLLLFHFRVAGVSTQVGEYAFLQCFDVTTPIDEVDNI